MQEENKDFKNLQRIKHKKYKGLFGNERTKKRNLILIIVPFFIMLCLFGVLTILSIKDLVSDTSDVSSNHSNEIEGMNIYLRDNATDLQKSLFEQLKAAYENGDDEEAARLTAESFIADFYTWTNKYGSYDVGGIYYCADRYNTEIYGRDTFYKYVSYYIDEYGSENLLEVTSVTAEGGYIQDSKYELNNTSYDVYGFDVSWEYADHPGFTENEYCTFQYIFVIKTETGRFDIVEAYG